VGDFKVRFMMGLPRPHVIFGRTCHLVSCFSEIRGGIVGERQTWEVSRRNGLPTWLELVSEFCCAVCREWVRE
jgi:hypothetical protein